MEEFKEFMLLLAFSAGLLYASMQKKHKKHNSKYTKKDNHDES